VAAKLEAVVDPAIIGQKTLRMTGGLEVLHMSFLSARRLMRCLGRIVQIPALAMLNTGHDAALGSRRSFAVCR
jgi:hypothetical protein